MSERPKLGQLLLDAGVIDKGQLAAALEEQKQRGRPLGLTLVARGDLDEETLVRTLARQLGLPVAWLRGKRIRDEVLELVPGEIVAKHRCLPVLVQDDGAHRSLLLAMQDPNDASVLDMAALAAGLPVRPVLAAPSELVEAIERHHPDLLGRFEALCEEPAEGIAEADRPADTIPDLPDPALAVEDEAAAELELPRSLPLGAGGSPEPAAAEGQAQVDRPKAVLPPSEFRSLGAEPAPELEPELDDVPDVVEMRPPGFVSEESPELLCVAEEPLGAPAHTPRPASPPAPSAGLGSVGPDVILRALSQLLVEKGLIDRDELIARLGQLSGRDRADLS